MFYGGVLCCLAPCIRILRPPASRIVQLAEQTTIFFKNPKSAMNTRNLGPVLRGRLKQRIGIPWDSNWICQSCQVKNGSKAYFSSSSRLLEKPYYVTTPIFYVNAGKIQIVILHIQLNAN
jgi:hypothetical protein